MLPASEGWDGGSFSQTLFLCLPPDDTKDNQAEDTSYPPTPSSPSILTLFAMGGFPSSQISEATRKNWEQVYYWCAITQRNVPSDLYASTAIFLTLLT